MEDKNEKDNKIKDAFINAFAKFVDNFISRKTLAWIVANIIMFISFYSEKYFDTIFWGWSIVTSWYIGADISQRLIDYKTKLLSSKEK